MSDQDNVSRREIKCAKCQFSTTGGALHLGKHLKEVHYQVWNEKCPHCEYSSKTLGLMVVHIRVNHVMESANGNERQNLKENIIDKERENKYKCEDCPHETNSKRNLKKHIKSVQHIKALRNKGAKEHKCEQCSYETHCKKNLENHIKSLHREREYKCEQCPFQAYQKGNLKTHVQCVHLKVRNYACMESGCGRRFKMKNHLMEHMNNVHEMGEKKFKCEQCPHETANKWSLTLHVNAVHKKVRNHFCEECGSRFSRNFVLKKHQLEVHDSWEVNEDGNLCSAYGRKLSHRGNIFQQAHEVKVKGMHLDTEQIPLQVLKDYGLKLEGLPCATTEEGQKFWLCPTEGCKKAFPKPNKLNLLKVHLMSHSNINPFKCTIKKCDWTFPDASKLKRHMNSHKKIKTAVCMHPTCGKEFATGYNLKKHYSLFHKNSIDENQPTIT